MEPWFLLSLILHRPPQLVRAVYDIGGIDAVVVVEMESQFCETALCREPQGTSWGLFQLYDHFHKQYRGDLLMHIVTGVAFLEDCKERAGGNFALAIAYYNGGSKPGAYSIAWGRRVEAKRAWLEARYEKAVEVRVCK